jgi:HEXXH motif-containing protein
LSAATDRDRVSTAPLVSERPSAWSANFDFAPDPVRADRLDQAVRDGVADSLQIVWERLDLSRSADDRRVASLLVSIRTGPTSPGLFGAYVELVLALYAERAGEAEALADELLRTPLANAGPTRIVTLDDQDLGEGQSARYRRLLSNEITCSIEPVSGVARESATAQLETAIDLLRDAAPDVAAELGVLVRQIVLVAPGESPDGVAFGGASTFSLWGALVLNANRLGDRLEVAVQLAHETAHCHLFGLALGGRLVNNDDAERHASPLRRDLRPMEGVAHATYVTARMIYALEELIASGQLDRDETMRARARVRQNEQAYEHGLATVLAHARFTPPGAAAFDGLRRFMDGRDPTGAGA